jgi:type 1 fimbria pilin
MKKQYIITLITVAALAAATSSFAHEGEKHDEEESHSKQITVTGEVVDLVCYIDHGATGADHADCARKCISMGLPVGIKTEKGETYMLVGEHKPINKKLAPLAAKTITVKGKAVERDGIHMLENVEIIKE